MTARLIRDMKRIFDDGTTMEMRLWEVPEPVLGSDRSLKYSLYFGRDGVRIVGYDNEREKGDHKDIDNIQSNYAFTSVDQLLADFLADVKYYSAER